jgi:hypothetical protein
LKPLSATEIQVLQRLADGLGTAEIEASGTINSRGQIAGYGLQKSTGEIHAILLTPSNSEFVSDSATLTAGGETSRGPKFVLPANVRKMLRARLGKPYLRGGFGGWSLK